MQVVSVNKSLSFSQWKSLNNNMDLIGDLFKNKKVGTIRKLNDEYNEYGPDECSLLLGKMNRILRDSKNVYDYDPKSKIIFKVKGNKNIPLNTSKSELLQGLYNEFQKLSSNKK